MEGEYVIKDGGVSRNMQLVRVYGAIILGLLFAHQPAYYQNDIAFWSPVIMVAFWSPVMMVAFWGFLEWITYKITPYIKASIFSDEMTIQGEHWNRRKSIRLTRDQIKSVNGYDFPADGFFKGIGLPEAFDGQSKWLGLIASNTAQTLAITTDDVKIIIGCKNAINTVKILRRVFELEPMEIKLPPTWYEYCKNKGKYQPSA